ncbi:MAG: glycosyltransferase family 4 protein [Planctomycetaceae bacterium]
MISLVSHLPLQVEGGGTFAVTWNVWQVLHARLPDLQFQHLKPPVDRWARFRSRICRKVLGRPGNFFTFSERALQQTADRLPAALAPRTQCVLFRTSTRWIACRPQVPYFVHLDAVFHTFHRNTFAAGEFAAADLHRIYEREAEFLEGAAAVFFESAWGLQQAVQHYRLRGQHYTSVGVAGNLPVPAVCPAGVRSRSVLTIAKRFAQKGGDYLAAGWLQLRQQFPDCTWHIVGGPAPAEVLQLPGVIHEGFLRPDVPAELLRMQTLLQQSSLLVHPTREDMNPLVLLEAAGFGCPAVTVRDFAIPELVQDGTTGVLLDRPLSGAALAAAIAALWNDPRRLQDMSQAAWQGVQQRGGWDAIGDRMAGLITDGMSQKLSF